MLFSISSVYRHITKTDKFMTENKDSNTISLLKREWEIYSKSHGLTQAQVSKKLGWSSSFFGSLLRGTSPFNVENQIKVANLFGIDPLMLNPECPIPQIISLKIYRTTSGNPSPADFKFFPVYDPERVCIYSDEIVLVRTGEGYDREEELGTDAGTIVGVVPIGVTLICSKLDNPAPTDPRFKADDLPTWLILEEGKSTKIYISRQKPKTRSGGKFVGNHRTLKKEVLRVLGMVQF